MFFPQPLVDLAVAISNQHLHMHFPLLFKEIQNPLQSFLLHMTTSPDLITLNNNVLFHLVQV